MTADPALFGAMADPTRWRVLELLAERGSASASGLAAEMPISRPGIIKHLAVLRAAGLISSQRVGREVRFSVRPVRLARAAAAMASTAAAWDQRLAALRSVAEDGERG